MQTVSGRNRMVGMPSMRYYTLNAENIGQCTFRMYYARSWEFDFADEANSKYVNKIVIPIRVTE